MKNKKHSSIREIITVEGLHKYTLLLFNDPEQTKMNGNKTFCIVWDMENHLFGHFHI